MLNTDERYIYLDELVPPSGYRLERAIATTFSLDLLCLLMTPVAMALHSSRNKADVLQNPMAVMKALQDVAGRVLVFCQKGRISIPKTDNLLYSLLEDIVLEVDLQKPHSVFHPKTWALRFVSDDQPIFYRFLCLSRNLTFDRCWDTVVSLEGPVATRVRGFGRNRPLREFIEHLPRLTHQSLRPDQQTMVLQTAEELSKVSFRLPPGVSDYRFVPVGIPGYRRMQLGKASRRLIVSPFVSPNALKRLTENGAGNIVVTRAESLDALPEAEISELSGAAELCELLPDVEAPEGDAYETTDRRNDPNLTGLHAKLYISEQGANARFLCGSANATDAGLGGSNVEFMIELTGRKRKVGVEAMLERDNPNSFGSMLAPYQRSQPTADDLLREELQRALEDARDVICSLPLNAQTKRHADGLFSVVCSCSSTEHHPMPPNVNACCYPITVQQERAQDIESLLAHGEALFANLPLHALTSFYAFELQAVSEGRSETLVFVLNIPSEGIPAERNASILRDIVSDRRKFVQFLLYLLVDPDSVWSLEAHMQRALQNSKHSQLTDRIGGIPLLEELLRTFSRNPQKLDDVADFLEELQKSTVAEDVFPEGFMELWQTIRQAAAGRETHADED